MFQLSWGSLMFAELPRAFVARLGWDPLSLLLLVERAISLVPSLPQEHAALVDVLGFNRFCPEFWSPSLSWTDNYLPITINLRDNYRS